MNLEYKKAGRAKLPRVVHWRSRTGKWMVVSGPFPEGFPRSETRDTTEKASKLLSDGVFARPATTKDDVFAKVLGEDIVEIHAGSNEWGPVTP